MGEVGGGLEEVRLAGKEHRLPGMVGDIYMVGRMCGGGDRRVLLVSEREV